MPTNIRHTYGGLILALVPLLFACEDDDFLSLPTDPGQANLDIRYVRVPVPFTVAQLDSIDTSPKQGNSKQLLAGSFRDPDFGMVTAINYVDFSAAPSNTVGDTATYQSLELELRYVRSYGAVQEVTQSLTVLPLDQRFDDNTVYYNTSELRTVPDALGNVTVTTKLIDEVDTLRFRLDNALGQEIFDRAQSGDTTVTSDSLFRDLLPGLALAPSTDKQLVGSFDPSGTRLIMNFTDASNEPQELVFTIRRFFNRIVGDFSGTALAGIEATNEGVTPTDGNFYLQSGTGVVPIISTDSIINFIRRQESDTRSVLLNRVDFNLALDDITDTVDAPSVLRAYEFDPETLERDSLGVDQQQRTVYGGFFSDQSAQPLAGPILLDSNRYQLAITNYLQRSVFNDTLSTKLIVLADDPRSSPENFDSSLSAIVTTPDSVYLNVYYTILE